jgi:phytoene synthase
MGARAPALVARACDLGVAMQLTNIARDVGEDARAGRLYLPRTWMREAGLCPDAWLRDPQFTPALGGVVARLLATADELYTRADRGIRALPLSCRPGIGAARHIYSEIGSYVRRHGCDSMTQRARVPGTRKVALIGRALMDTFSVQPRPHGAALPETAFLVDAVARSAAQPRAPLPLRAQVADRIVWVAELFRALDARDRARMERA